MKDPKYRNYYTGEIKSASKFAWDFNMDGYKNSEKGNRTAHPKQIPKDDLIKMGIELMKDDIAWEELKEGDI